MRNSVSRYPYMVLAGEVHLVDWPILLSPVGELDPAQLFGYFRHTTDNGPA